MDAIKVKSGIRKGKKIHVLLNIHCYVNFYPIYSYINVNYLLCFVLFTLRRNGCIYDIQGVL